MRVTRTLNNVWGGWLVGESGREDVANDEAHMPLAIEKLTLRDCFEEGAFFGPQGGMGDERSAGVDLALSRREHILDKHHAFAMWKRGWAE